MHDPVEQSGLTGYLLLLLRQFAGGPGPIENNLMRFGLPMVLWAALVWVAWSRRKMTQPRERMLIWGFLCGCLREGFMFVHVSLHLITGRSPESVASALFEPLEHALNMVAVIVVAGAFLRYFSAASKTSYRYLTSGVGLALLSYVTTAPWWHRYVVSHPTVKFHQTWAAWVMHVTASLAILVAMVLLIRRRHWLARVVTVALLLFFLSESIMLYNFATDKRHATVICPIGNTLHLLAIPVLGYVYLREQALERQRLGVQLGAYRDHLEAMVQTRTEALSAVNEQLKQEIRDREGAEQALARLSRSHALILHSAGEGIFGVDVEGHHTFVNRAAADMLGYEPEELIGKPSHPAWHHSYPDGSVYPESMCPLHAGYKSGVVRQGDDQVFWRRDGTSFPVRYISTPIFAEGRLEGAVIIFQDISEEKRAAAEAARSNAELAVQAAIAATISASLDLDTILDTALEVVLSELGVGAGCVLLEAEVASDVPTDRCDTTDVAAPELQHLVSRQVSGRHLQPTDVCPCLQCDVIARRVIADRMPLVMASSAAELVDGASCLARSDTHALVGVPLMTKNQAVGAIVLALREEQREVARSLDLLIAIGQQIGIAVENARLYREAERWARELALLHESSVSLNAMLDLDAIYHEATQQALRLLECQSVGLYLWQEGACIAERVAVSGTEDIEGGVPAMLEIGTAPWLDRLHERRALLMLNAAGLELGATGAVLVVPLWGTGQPLGFLMVVRGSEHQPWRRDTVALAESFANLVTVVLEKARLHRHAERAAALEERQRIAADMHDGLAQTFSYLGHQIDSLLELVGNGHGGRAILTGERIRQKIDQASHEVRHLIASLQSQPHPPQSLQALLEATMDDARRGQQVEMVFSANQETPVFISAEQAEQVDRVVHEALLNALHHAGAERIDVALEAAPQTFTIAVADDGCGFKLGDDGRNDSGHFGLSIMRARAARLGGGLEIRTRPGEGTRVELRWPREQVAL